ncbi:MAG: NUDIX domain-containing protein [Candidatus Paceibacterota bacterium]
MVKQIEVVGGAIIENSKKEILLVKSPKWGDRWVMPGGHIELGETIEEAIRREAEEEVGLKNLKSCGIVSFGEVINSKEFHRPAHLIYFDVLFKTKNDKIKLDKKELSEYIWVEPRKALKMKLAIGYDKTIKDYLKH